MKNSSSNVQVATRNVKSPIATNGVLKEGNYRNGVSVVLASRKERRIAAATKKVRFLGIRDDTHPMITSSCTNGYAKIMGVPQCVAIPVVANNQSDMYGRSCQKKPIAEMSRIIRSFAKNAT